MTPNELAKSGSEHSEQRAFFAWLNMAARYGFQAANDDRSYNEVGYADAIHANSSNPEPRCAWAFAIPNGGKRDKATAGKLKAEGVKPGVPDVFLPAPIVGSPTRNPTAGLFIELKRSANKTAKRSKGRTSDKQDDWHDYLVGQWYTVVVCMNWREAADAVTFYLKGDHDKLNQLSHETA